MRKILFTIAVLLVTSLISCEKDDTLLLKNVPKEDLKQCRGCGGTWDLIDTKR
jgi:hypothetical protein